MLRRITLTAGAALAVLCLGSQTPARGEAATHFDQDVEALVELNYYVNESTANVVFDLPSDKTAGNATAKATLDRPSGADVEAEAALSPDGPTFLELPIGDLPPGRYPVKLSVTASGREVWQGDDVVVKLPPPPKDARVTQVDRYRRIMLVDGEGFFPMGVFGVFPEYLQQAADAGFNVTLRWKGATTMDRYHRAQPWDHPSNRAAVREYLDAIHKAGMYAVETPVKLVEESMYVKFRDPKWHEKYPIVNREITPGIIKNAHDHPAVIGYYSHDEPDNFYPDQPDHPKHLMMQEGVEDWYNVVHEIDPYHAVMTLFAVGLSKVEDWKAWDVAMRDYYIGRDAHMSKVYDTAVDSVRVAWAMRTPFVYTPLFEKSSGRPVPLSPEEQRAQAYLSLVADVKGVFYWDWPAAYEPNWQMLKQLAGEVKELSPILLERSPRQEVTYSKAGTDKSVKALIKEHDGKTYLIAVNAEPAPVDVTFNLPEGFGGAADVWFEDRSVEVSNGVLSDSFEPYGRHVYELPSDSWRDGDALTIDVNVGEKVNKPDPKLKATNANLLVNGSFEYDFGSLPGWPYEWHISDSIMESGVVQQDGRWTPVTGEARHGSRSMRLIKSAPGRADSDGVYNLGEAPAIHQSVRYPSSGPYTFSVWLKASKPSLVWIMNGWEKHYPIQVGTEWEQHHVTYERNGAGNSFVRVVMLDQGTLWIDAAQIEKGATPTEYKHQEAR